MAVSVSLLELKLEPALVLALALASLRARGGVVLGRLLDAVRPRPRRARCSACGLGEMRGRSAAAVKEREAGGAPGDGRGGCRDVKRTAGSVGRGVGCGGGGGTARGAGCPT